MSIINIKNLTKYYGKSKGVENLNLVVEKGDYFGFIGPNGAGKSTTLRLLLSLIKKDSGEISVFDKDIKDEEYLKDVGYLPSESFFYNNMKVIDVLKLSSDLRNINCDEERNILVNRLKLDVNKKINELSFGNRKKVGIVCALQHKPKLFILDEPTTGLDPLIQKEFYSILKEYNDSGTTILMSSHVLSEVENHCNKAAIIKNGTIIASDYVDKLSKTTAHQISVKGNINIDDFKDIKNYKYENETHSFLYNGDINELIKALSKSKLVDLKIEEPSLEEIFLHYYK